MQCLLKYVTLSSAFKIYVIIRRDCEGECSSALQTKPHAYTSKVAF